MTGMQERQGVCFSMDLEWAPDEVLEPVLELFRRLQLPVTVFATHKTPLLTSPPTGVEVGIHPDFFRNPDHGAHLLSLLAAYPAARGVRTHRLFEYSALLQLFHEHGLSWDSSQQLWMCPHLRPYRHPSGIARLPIYWEDDDYLCLGPDWNAEALKLGEPGIKCLDFHPFWLYMNCCTASDMDELKAGGYTAQAARQLRRDSGQAGLAVLLERMADTIQSQGLPVYTLDEVCAWA